MKNIIKEYSVSQLFSTSYRKLIIPDFQRDYCWGDKTHGKNKVEIVSSFLETLKEESLSSKGNETFLGKLDVYESFTEQIYITDGQQRLTTLYLIIGMLYKLTKIENLKNCLISKEEELTRDKEPYLQYAIRESSLLFIRDLVNDFFVKENTYKASEIKKQSWFFNEYSLCPTINSIINALGIIEKNLNETSEFKLDDFSDFILNRVKIQYYDVVDRTHGEERFVIINTTGKSLTESENVKPILLGKMTNEIFSKQWEERETWFWKNRNVDEEICDDGVNTFLYWCFQIFEKHEEVDLIKKSKELFKNSNSTIEIKLQLLNKYFESIKYLLTIVNSNYKIQQQLKYINHDNQDVKTFSELRNLSKERQQIILIPLLAFIVNISSAECDVYLFLRRLRKNYYDNIRKERASNFIDWKDILHIIENSSSLQEVLTFHFQGANKNGSKNQWYNSEEKHKEYLKIKHSVFIEEWEDNPDFMGDLSPLFKVSQNSTDITVLNSYHETYLKIKINNFTFTDDIELRNRYILNDLLLRGEWENRSVGGYGYCMLCQNEGYLFNSEIFFPVWNLFNSKENFGVIIDFLKDRLREFFNENVFKIYEYEVNVKKTKEIHRHKLVKIWAILEFLNAKETTLDFSKNIACYWEWPNLVKIEKNKESYEFGNLLLGTSYYNNKTGDLLFDKFPLMKELFHKRNNISPEEIAANTKKYIELLAEEFNCNK